MERDRQIFLSFWAIFCTFTLLTTSKIKILKKWKKNSEDIIILHKCTINDNHIIYVSWDMERDRHNFLSFWAIFCPFTPLTTSKIKILKKKEKILKISSFYKSVPKIIIICYVPQIWRVTNVIFIFHFGLFLALLSP